MARTRSVKKIKYTRVRADGRAETFAVPVLWDPFEVAEKMRQSMVFAHIPSGYSVFAIDPTTGQEKTVPGPVITFIDRRAGRSDYDHYLVPYVPKNDSDALHLWKYSHGEVA
jgi:hypothetical protein